MSNNISKQIIDNVGGVDNIKSLTHCVTRLRLNVKNKDKINQSELDKLPKVATTLFSGDQFQIVIGQDVADIYDDIVSSYNIEGASGEVPEGSTTDKNYLDRLMNTLSSIFTPLIPAMQGMGFLKVVLVLWDLIDVGVGNSTYELIRILSDSFFYFLPILVAWSASRVFKVNSVISLMLVSFLVHPEFLGLLDSGTANFLGIPVPSDVLYTGSILPAILTVFTLSYVYKFLGRILPGILRTVFLSFLSLIIMLPITILIIGPIGNFGGAILVQVFNALYNFSPLLSGFIIGGLWQLIIIFGMHWLVLTLIQFPNIANFGIDRVTVAFAPSIMAQVAAGAAVALKVKDKKVKNAIWSLVFTSFFSGGVIEPVMYGVNIKYKKPFYFVLLGGAIGGAITGAAGAGITAPVMFGIYTLPAFFGVGFIGLMIGTIVGSIVTFVLTYMFGVDEEIEAAHTAEIYAHEETVLG